MPEVPAGMAMDSGDEWCAAGDGANGSYSLKPAADFIETVPASQLGWYASWGFIGYQIAAILSQHWLVNKICTMPARDAMRNGFELSFNEGDDVPQDVINKIKKFNKKFKIRSKAVQFVRKGRIFGIRIAMFQINSSDKEFYAKPFNIDGVTKGSYCGITQLDPYWITPELDANAAANPASEHFYEPTWWRVNGRRIHRTHLIIFRNGEVPDILKPSYMYGGIPVPQNIAERVYAAERTANEAPMLSLSKRTTVIHTDVEKAIANQALFDQKMQMWTAFRDNYGVKIAGSDEPMEQFDTSLADFDNVIMTQYTIACAAGGCPSSKVMGTSPKGGLGSEGEYDADSYHEELETIQTNDMEPFIDRHHLLLMKSEFDGKYEVEIAWNAVDSMTAKGQAEVNLIKAQTGNALVTSGAIDGTDERTRVIADKDSGYNGLDDRVPDMPGDDDGDPDADAD